MGVHDRTHPGHLLASQRQTDQPSDHSTCGFCGTTIDDERPSERVEHVLPAGGGNDERTDQYCSPSCFVRQMERVSGIE